MFPILLALICSTADTQADALFAAARKGDVATVRKLLDDGVDPNSKTAYGATALTFAADKGHTAVVRLLLDKKADVNSKDTFYGTTAITWAFMRGHAEVVGQLLDGGATGASGLLVGAARSGEMDMVKVLIEKGKPNAATLTLAWAAATKPEVIDLLKKAGAIAPEAKKKVSGPPPGPYLGHFKNSEAGEVEVAAKDGELILKVDGQAVYTLVHDKDEIFKPEGGNGTFEFTKSDGKVTKFVRKSESGPDRTFERFEKTVKSQDVARVAPEPTGRPTTAGNWPQFRGAGATGVADGQFPPTNFDAKTGKNMRWKTPIPGLGHACPVVWGDRIFIATAVSGDAKATLKPGQYGDVDSVEDKTEHQWKLICLDKSTGSVVWDKTASRGIPKIKRHLKGTHANPTPATDGQRVVVSFGAEGLFCYDRDGQLVWKQDLGPLDAGWFFDPDYQWGFGSSPVIFEDKVIVQCDVGKDSYLAAFSLADGKLVWKTEREEIPSWGTPTVIVGPTRTEIVTNATKFARGYDPATGKELWKLGKHSEITVPTPFLSNGFIIVCSGYRPVQPIYAIRPGATGDISLKKDEKSNDSVAWSLGKGGPYMPTPIAYGPHLYVCSNSGMLTCYDVATGKSVYTERMGGTGGYTASPVAADGRLYFTSEEGGIRVVKAGSKFELLAINPVGEVCMATPAIADGLFLLRTQGHLIAFGLPR